MNTIIVREKIINTSECVLGDNLPERLWDYVVISNYMENCPKDDMRFLKIEAALWALQNLSNMQIDRKMNTGQDESIYQSDPDSTMEGMLEYIVDFIENSSSYFKKVRRKKDVKCCEIKF